MTRENLNWKRQDVPPPLGRVLHIMKTSATDRHSLVSVAPTIYGLWTHWHSASKRTVIHTVGKEPCPYCEKDIAKRWVGFLHVWRLNPKAQFFLELTALAAHRLLDAVPDRENLRGRQIFVFRERATVKAPMSIEDRGEYAGVEPLPEPKDPAPTLARLWGLAR